MVESGSAESFLRGRISRRPFPGKCFLHLHTGLQVQWWLMMSTAVLTSQAIKTTDATLDLPDPRRSCSIARGYISGLYFLV